MKGISAVLCALLLACSPEPEVESVADADVVDTGATTPSTCSGPGPQCAARMCSCGIKYTICSECYAGQWRWPIDDNCYFGCRDTGPLADTASDASTDSEVGPCGPGKHVAYATPGCGAEPTCLPDGPEDACASTFCGCDGTTFAGNCGYAPKPFASTGVCPDAG